MRRRSSASRSAWHRSVSAPSRSAKANSARWTRSPQRSTARRPETVPQRTATRSQSSSRARRRASHLGPIARASEARSSASGRLHDWDRCSRPRPPDRREHRALLSPLLEQCLASDGWRPSRATNGDDASAQLVAPAASGRDIDSAVRRFRPATQRLTGHVVLRELVRRYRVCVRQRHADVAARGAACRSCRSSEITRCCGVGPEPASDHERRSSPENIGAPGATRQWTLGLRNPMCPSRPANKSLHQRRTIGYAVVLGVGSARRTCGDFDSASLRAAAAVAAGARTDASPTLSVAGYAAAAGDASLIDPLLAATGSASRMNSSAARSGSMWLALMNAITLRPVSRSISEVRSSRIAP